MDIEVRLSDLPFMHPRLLWDDIVAAAAAVLDKSASCSPCPFHFETIDLSHFDDGSATFLIDSRDVSTDHVSRIRRTYEPHRIIELAAIAIAGVALFQVGAHEIRDVALRGTGADYLVDESNHILEIAGRSRKNDLLPAWQKRMIDLATRALQVIIYVLSNLSL
jgi:hypothetical protein